MCASMNKVDKGKKKLYRDNNRQAITGKCQRFHEYLAGQVEEHLKDWQDIAFCSPVPG